MKVSVAIVTYNHEAFLAKALDSVLMQRTDFEYEIVVGEDCSTDTTRSILVDYQKRFPGKFVLFLNEKNLGMYKNGAQVLQACRGEYIAMLDGDDYWTSPDKLQKQVDFLAKHPECTVCYHDALIVHEDNSEEPIHYRPKQKAFSSLEDLLLDNFIPTAAVMFHREVLGRVPAWAETLKMGDWVLHVLNALNGKIGYLDETMSVYLIHRGGIWSTKAPTFMLPAMVEFFEALYQNLEPQYTAMIRRILRWRCNEVSKVYEEEGDIEQARKYLLKAMAKQLRMILEPPRLAKSRTDLDRLMPEHITSLTGAKLLKRAVKLFLVPVMKRRLPSVYRLLRRFA